MKIKVSESDRVEISGKFNSYENYVKIKKAIQNLINSGSKEIELEFLDALTITSTMIGYFAKSSQVNGVKFILIIHNERLIQLMTHLGLDQAFDIRKPE